jgi:hypothetical protein
VKQQKKTERAVKGLQSLLAQLGVDQTVIKEAVKNVPLTPQDLSMHAEAVLLSLQQPAHFMSKKCKYCGEYFGTNYRAVAYCSDSHRAKALRAEGIEWNPHKTAEERWGGEPPLVIPPEARRKLVKFAQVLLAQEEILQRETQTSESLPEPVGISVLPESGFDFEVPTYPEPVVESKPGPESPRPTFDFPTIPDFSLPLSAGL